MPSVRIPIDLTWSGATGSPGVNIWHARLDEDPFVEADMNDILDMLKAFYDEVGNASPNTMLIEFRGEAQGILGAEGDTFSGTPWAVGGSGGAGFLPPMDCMYVNWGTSTGGRSGRGRTFIGPLATVVGESNGTPSETYRGALQGAADDLIAASSGFSNGALGIFSRTDNVIRDLTTADVPNKFASLRSRRD